MLAVLLVMVIANIVASLTVIEKVIHTHMHAHTHTTRTHMHTILIGIVKWALQYKSFHCTLN